MDRNIFKCINKKGLYWARSLAVMTTPLQGVGPRFKSIFYKNAVNDWFSTHHTDCIEEKVPESPGGPIFYLSSFRATISTLA